MLHRDRLCSSAQKCCADRSHGTGDGQARKRGQDRAHPYILLAGSIDASNCQVPAAARLDLALRQLMKRDADCQNPHRNTPSLSMLGAKFMHAIAIAIDERANLC